jgi:hypothetical protein
MCPPSIGCLIMPCRQARRASLPSLVEVNYGDSSLKLGRATREQQEKIVDAWLARHSAGS